VFGGRRKTAASLDSGRCANRRGTVCGSRIDPIRLRSSACKAGRPDEHCRRASVSSLPLWFF